MREPVLTGSDLTAGVFAAGGVTGGWLGRVTDLASAMAAALSAERRFAVAGDVPAVVTGPLVSGRAATLSVA